MPEAQVGYLLLGLGEIALEGGRLCLDRDLVLQFVRDLQRQLCNNKVSACRSTSVKEIDSEMSRLVGGRKMKLPRKHVPNLIS